MLFRSGEKITRIKRKRKRKKLAPKEVRCLFGADYAGALRGVDELNDYFLQHPLKLPLLGGGVSHYAACAKRVLHNERLDSGGRLYGAWTSIDSNLRRRSEDVV